MDDATFVEHHLELDPHPNNRDICALWHFVVSHGQAFAVFRGVCTSILYSGGQLPRIRQRNCCWHDPCDHCTVATFDLGGSAIRVWRTKRFTVERSIDID